MIRIPYRDIGLLIVFSFPQKSFYFLTFPSALMVDVELRWFNPGKIFLLAGLHGLLFLGAVFVRHFGQMIAGNNQV